MVNCRAQPVDKGHFRISKLRPPERAICKNSILDVDPVSCTISSASCLTVRSVGLPMFAHSNRNGLTLEGLATP